MMEPDRSPVTGILGGTFDRREPRRPCTRCRRAPPRPAGPGHRPVVADSESRLRLAEAAFAGLPAEVVLDDNAYTVDAVRGGRFGEALFVVGADEGGAFSTWKEPEEVLRWVKLAVGTRSGYPP